MKIHTLDTGLFKLDGGAMYGVVPKSMWQKLNPPDANNMCTWAMRCLLIEDGGRLLLVDNGIGEKQDEKIRGHFYLHGDDTLEKSLRKLGFASIITTFAPACRANNSVVPEYAMPPALIPLTE